MKACRFDFLPNDLKTEPLVINVVRNPIEDVKKAYDEKDYIKAITYACAVIQYLGKLKGKMRKRFETTKVCKSLRINGRRWDG